MIPQPGIIRTGSSRHCVSYEMVIKSDRLDVKASDMILMPGAEDLVVPIIEDEIELQGVIHHLTKVQPLLHTSFFDSEALYMTIGNLLTIINSDRSCQLRLLSQSDSLIL